MKRIIFVGLVIAFIFIVLLLGCTAPPVVPPTCSEPDGTKITASRGTIGTGGMVITGAAGAVEPGATVKITDGQGKSVTTTANENGGFVLMEADLPDGFDHTVGNNLDVTQDSEGCSESNPVTVPISP